MEADRQRNLTEDSLVMMSYLFILQQSTVGITNQNSKLTSLLKAEWDSHCLSAIVDTSGQVS